MKHLNLTLPTPEENLACDEVLLNTCEDNLLSDEVLRFWEPDCHFVVLGYSNKVDLEVNRDACQASGIPIYRRCSGGGTVLQGPGCLNYTLILDIRKRKSIWNLVKTNTFILTKHKKAFESILKQKVEICGTSDLAINNLKFSGNAQRRKKNFVLFHGTFLLNFDIGAIEQFLRLPTKQPTYRHNRSHTNFLTNLNADANIIQKTLKESWQANGSAISGGQSPIPGTVPNLNLITQLAKDQYLSPEWNLKF